MDVPKDAVKGPRDKLWKVPNGKFNQNESPETSPDLSPESKWRCRYSKYTRTIPIDQDIDNDVLCKLGQVTPETAMEGTAELTLTQQEERDYMPDKNFFQIFDKRTKSYVRRKFNRRYEDELEEEYKEELATFKVKP